MFNISIDPKNFKKYLAIGLIVLIALIIIGALIAGRGGEDELPKWAEDKPQSFDEIEDVRIAMPYVTDSYSINYIKEDDLFTVEYAGWISDDTIEVQIVSWFKNNTDLKKVKIRYQGIGKEPVEYDLTKNIAEILKDNPLINNPNVDKSQFGRS